MKIQYASRRPLYDKAVISVQDHVECRCQNVPLPKPARTAPKKLHPRRQPPKDPLGRARSKEELHRRDELKWNQNVGAEERRARYPPPPRGDNALPGHARAPESQTGRPPLRVNLTGRREEEEAEERALLTGLGLRRPAQDVGERGLQGNGLNATGLGLTENATQGRRREPHQGRQAAADGRSRVRGVAVDTWAPEAWTTQSPLRGRGDASQPLTEARRPAGGADETWHTQTERRGGPAEGRDGSGPTGAREERLTLEREEEALLSLQRELDEENRRIRVLERQQHHHHQHHHLHHPTPAHTTTQTTGRYIVGCCYAVIRAITIT